MTHCVGLPPRTSNKDRMEDRVCQCGHTDRANPAGLTPAHSVESSYSVKYDVRPHSEASEQPSSSSWHRTRNYNKCKLTMSLVSTICYTLCVLILTAGTVSAQDSLRYTVSEEAESEQFVGDVFQDADLTSKYEGNPTILNQLRFRFLRGEHPNFVINSRTGEISTSGTIDRESQLMGCANLDICDIRLDVAVHPVQYFQIIKVTVEILDVNDHHPTFSERQVIHSVPESTLPDSGIVTLNVQDLDSPDNSIQRFELLPATSTKFRVTSSSQIDGSIEIKLKLQETLDREMVSEYNLRVVAYDGGNPAKTGSVDIQLVILDTNDNSPTFESPTYEVSILEDILVPEAIIQVKASDPDAGSNGEILYGFTASTLRHYRDTFTMNAATGEIRLISPVDFEGTSLYTLGVTALDRGPSAISADATVVVTVLDVNDHAPGISISTLAEDGSSNAVVPENAPPGTFVSHFSVMDQDSGDNARVSCHLDSNHFSLEFLYDNEYQILTLNEFDREILVQYSVKVICQDNGTPSLTSETIIPVDISDVNDHAPQFEHNVYNAELIENNFEGAVAMRVKATDRDTGINAEMEYSIEDKVKHLFSVDPDTGDVQARVGIDREQVDKFQFEVYATDKGEPRRSAITNVIIHIEDVNDEQPIFNQPNYSFGVFENEEPGTDVGILLAEDKDSFPFNQFMYRFSHSTDAFSLNPDTGRITTRRVLDREEQAVYHLIAEAVDDGSPGGSSSTVSVSIYIADQNDNYPQFTFPNLVNNTASVAKDVPYGYIITRLNAVDMDIGNNARVVYGIASGNEDRVFDIDFDRGTILVNKDLTVLEDMSFTLNVTATDSGVPNYMVWSLLTVFVNGSVVVQPVPTTPPLSLRGNNLVIVIALASTSGVITIILVMAIICIRRQDRNRDQGNGKYNCRMEALKFINGNRRKKLVEGSTSSGSTTNGSDNGDSINKARKEVSFSVEMEDSGADLAQNKSAKSWCSIIDHQTLQTPRACSSLLTPNGTSIAGVHLGNGNLPGNGTLRDNPPPYQENQRGTYAASTNHRHIPNNHREIEIQQLLEMLKRDQDSSSLTSGEGSNTDSGRGVSEEGETGSRIPATLHTHDTYTQGMAPGQLAPVPEDSYSSNQVVPGSCCDSSISFLSHQNNTTSFLSHHNTTNGSYLPSEQLRAASRNSQQSHRPFSSASSHPQHSTKGDSTILEISEQSSQMDNAFYNDGKKSPKLKSILKSTVKSPRHEHMTPAAQQGIDNYIKSRMDGKYRRSNSSEHSELESEIGELKYSCADMSDILHSKTCTDISEFLQAKAATAMDVDDDASSATSGSYVVDPKELCDEIDELFFKNMV